MICCTLCLIPVVEEINTFKFMGANKKIILLVSLIPYLFLQSSAFALTVDRVLATVNNEIITLTDYKNYASKLNPLAHGDIIDQDVLESLIEQKIILQEARKAGIETTPGEVDQAVEELSRENNLTVEQFNKKLADDGISRDEYRSLVEENILLHKIIDSEVNSKILISDSDIHNFYEQNKHLFLNHPEKVTVKALFLKMSSTPTVTEATDLKIKSMKLASEIRDEAQLDKMVALYSDEPLKSRHGILGEFEKGGLIPVLEKKISLMKEGEISAPLWTKEGVYIAMLMKRSRESYVTLEKVKEQIFSNLYELKREEKFNEWMKSLWVNSSVKIKEQ